MLHTPAISISGRPDQVFSVTPAELAAALEADAQAWLDPAELRTQGN